MARPARKKAPSPGQLQMAIDRIPAAPPRPAPAPAPVMPKEEPQRSTYVNDRYARPDRPAFGAWLLKQKGKGGLIGQLADGAAADRAFPKAGDPEAVRARLRAVMADGDMYEAVDDAESAWLAS
jgi:hypothetical protein